MLRTLLQTLLSAIYSVWLWSWIFIIFFTHFIFVSLTAWIMPKPYEYSQYWAKKFLTFGMMFSGPLVSASGRENIPKKAFILASNHQSLLDTALHIIQCPELLLFTPKVELTRIPILGWDIRMQGHVSMDRSNARNAVKSLQNVVEKLKNQRAFIFFPEGTRSTDDTIAPFKKGAFKVAHQAKVPVVPAYIHRAHIFLNKKRGLLAIPIRVSVVYGAPIEGADSPEALMKQTEDAVRELQKNLLKDTQKN